MFKVTIKVQPKAAKRREAINSLWSLSAAYHRSGQTVGDTIVSGGKGVLALTGIVHERSSLSKRKDPSGTREAWRKLRLFLRGTAAITFEPLVEDIRTCGCPRVREVVFDPLPHPVDPASPLRCRQCKARVPLYRFHPRPATDHEFGGLLSAETIWKGFHWAWMDSAETEALGWKQIADPDSELNRLIRRRLRVFARSHKLRVYSYLQPEYWTDRGVERSVCPGCGRNWSVDGDGRDGLSCHRCLLISEVSSDGRLPRWRRPLPRHRRGP